MKRFECTRGSLLVIFSLFALSCIERFVPEETGFKKVLVVEGSISDLDGPNTIRLSRSRPLNSPEAAPERGAVVFVTSSEDERFDFSEVSAGTYQSDPSEFVAVPGEIYTLNILTTDGEHYQSEPVKLKVSPPIDSVYYESSTRLTETQTDTLSGIAILLDTHDDTNETRYYRWEWEEAWEIRVPYPNTYDWVVYVNTVPTAERPGYEVFHNRPTAVCYNSDKSRQILISTSRALEQDIISKFELAYVSSEGYRLNTLYSILVRQYALDEKEFTYWSELESTSESLGTLFDPQPYELRGNISNVNDEDEVVLGYFSGSTVSEARIFIDRHDLDGVVFPISSCVEDRIEVENKWVQSYIEQGYLIAGLGSYGSQGYFLAPAPCCDCTYHGVLEKPDFWPELN